MVIKKAGFSLIEIMVVMTIVAILAAIAMIVYSSVNTKARDAVRLSDFANLNQAIQLAIHNAQGTDLNLCTNLSAPCSATSYPLTADTQKTTGNGWLKISLDQGNIANFSQLPIDPINNSTYNYSYFSDGTIWRIETTLESSTYQNKMQSDGGTDPNKYEVGSKVIE